MSGVGFFGLLTIVFITLKLTSYIDWSWWWVLGPLWIPPVTIIGGVFIGGIGYIAWSTLFPRSKHD